MEGIDESCHLCLSPRWSLGLARDSYIAGSLAHLLIRSPLLFLPRDGARSQDLSSYLNAIDQRGS